MGSICYSRSLSALHQAECWQTKSMQQIGVLARLFEVGTTLPHTLLRWGARISGLSEYQNHSDLSRFELSAPTPHTPSFFILFSIASCCSITCMFSLSGLHLSSNGSNMILLVLKYLEPPLLPPLIGC